MVSIRKVAGLMCCGCLLCLGLSSAAQAGNAARAGDPASLADPAVRKGGQAGVRGEQGKLKGGHRIEGDLLRVEGEYYFVMGRTGRKCVCISTAPPRRPETLAKEIVSLRS